jgi:REP element-mobilizing transposase RayT
MGYARKSLISLNDTPYYHVVARCVRRAWLWGFDEYAGRDYSHRKEWILERLSLLASIFTIDVCAFAVMSNHYHLVLFVDEKRAKALTREEVIERWTKVFGTPTCIRRYLSGEAFEAERELAESVIERWRLRLYDISWFMKCINEQLARRANAEDNCTGKFWEGRFKSQALLDEAGLLTAMAYVDLNPIRAGIAATPEESEFTSIYDRIQSLKQKDVQRELPDVTTVPLRPFASGKNDEAAIPFTLSNYLELVDWTGRCVRDDKRGFIDERIPAIAGRLNIDAEAWKSATTGHSGHPSNFCVIRAEIRQLERWTPSGHPSNFRLIPVEIRHPVHT